ncbi:dihydrofolate reductase family protein [Sphaerisporangium sp. B11E5]|uniref:dihydrofolate reductase family protein n=1 Tax=Sphaerisporangium sp. B11E5 TaxID=3153563 RepID=UPI00325E05E5
MPNVILDISMSLDGYVTGPGDEIGRELGEGGEALHHWVFGGPWHYDGPLGTASSPDRDILDELFSTMGAFVIGRRMYDIVQGWGDDPPFAVPCFVLTHRGQDGIVKGDTSFTFVTDGIASAVAKAVAAAGDKDVSIGGGAAIAQQALAAGLVNEMQIHLAPVLLGAGIRLFDHVPAASMSVVRVVDSPLATHIKYRL